MSAHKTTVSEILQHLRVTEMECALIEVATGCGAMFVAMQATFHIVIDGHCHLRADDGSFSAPLAAGDFALVPHGRLHSVNDGPNVAALSATHAQRVPLALERDVPVLLRFGHGERPAFRVLSGAFRFPAMTATPIVSALPALLHRPSAGAITLCGSDLATKVMEPGGRALTLRLADLMLLESVRGNDEIMDRIASLGPVWLRTFRIEKAVSAVSTNPSHPWTLETLARYAGMSRTTFAEKYLARLGVPPMQHVASIRLRHAAFLLRSTILPVSEVARQSGYTSESSFARVFRNHHGESPLAYRKAAWIQPLNV